MVVYLGINLATNAQRDNFAENPVQVIKDCCLKLADYSDVMIRDVDDSLILQPASLEVVCAHRRPGEEDFGLTIDHAQPHVISDVRMGSLAYQCGRIRPGDEIVQVNYQTVVGWGTKRILEEINGDIECTEIILTLKKVPKELHGGGRHYIQPFAIPLKQQQFKKTSVQVTNHEVSVPTEMPLLEPK